MNKYVISGFIVVIGFIFVSSAYATNDHHHDHHTDCPKVEEVENAYKRDHKKCDPTPTEEMPTPTETITQTPTPTVDVPTSDGLSDGKSSCPECTQAPKVDNQSGQELLPPSQAAK